MLLPVSIRDRDRAASRPAVNGSPTHGPARPVSGNLVVHHPVSIGTFEFVIISSLRAAQLMRGCRPRVLSTHKRTITAQLEVAAGEIVRLPATIPGRDA